MYGVNRSVNQTHQPLYMRRCHIGSKIARCLGSHLINHCRIFQHGQMRIVSPPFSLFLYLEFQHFTFKRCQSTSVPDAKLESSQIMAYPKECSLCFGRYLPRNAGRWEADTLCCRRWRNSLNDSRHTSQLDECLAQECTRSRVYFRGFAGYMFSY